MTAQGPSALPDAVDEPHAWLEPGWRHKPPPQLVCCQARTACAPLHARRQPCGTQRSSAGTTSYWHATRAARRA
eukprot:213761-Chlamydomonas_euryale.AAC.3